MKFCTLVDKNKIVVPAECKVIPKEDFTHLLDAQELLQEIEKERQKAQEQAEALIQQLHQTGQQKGFEEGLQQWSNQLAFLEQELVRYRTEVAQSMAPIAMAAIKKIIGKELEVNPQLVADIVKTALRPVSQHRKVKIYVHKADLDTLESKRNDIKDVFEHLETLAILVREDVAQGGCIIETEGGIINAQLDLLLGALEGAFRDFFKNTTQSEGS